MLAFSAKVAYAVQLLRSLKRRGRQVAPVPLQSVARELRLPYRYLAQIARRLRHAGLVASFEGANGGYWLAKAPAAISLNAIIAALEPNRRLAPCPRPPSARRCPCGGDCGAQAWWRTVDSRLQRALRHLTLAQIR